jgi:hypothetical protein
MVPVFAADTGAELAAFLSPYQTPAYRNIQVSVVNSGAAGAHDEVIVTARTRHRTVSTT